MDGWMDWPLHNDVSRPAPLCLKYLKRGIHKQLVSWVSGGMTTL